MTDWFGVFAYYYLVSAILDATTETAAHMSIVCFVWCFSALLGTLYKEHKDEDGFLYMAYSGENTFGF